MAGEPSLYRCPDCAREFRRLADALGHMQDAHAAAHPGQEATARTKAWELLWTDEEVYDLGLDDLDIEEAP